MAISLRQYCVLLLCLVAVGCATPKTQAFKPYIAPADISESGYIAVDGEALAHRIWKAEGEIQAIIIALHGFNDYSNAHRMLAEYMTHHGIMVYAYDQRGFGNSGNSGIWAGEHNLSRDLENAITALKSTHPSIPIYVLGESMGGAVALYTAAKGTLHNTEGIILVAPAIWGKQTMPWLYRTPLWIAAHTSPASHVGDGGLEIWPSDNIEMLIAHSNDPLVLKKSRIDTIYGVALLMDKAYDAIAQHDIPTLFLYGANDQIIPKEPVLRIWEQELPHIHPVYYPKGFHMLTRDIARQQVYDDILTWIQQGNNHPLPSGHDRNVIERIRAGKDYHWQL